MGCDQVLFGDRAASCLFAGGVDDKAGIPVGEAMLFLEVKVLYTDKLMAQSTV